MIDRVLSVMKEAAETAILPRFRALPAGDIEEKSPGEVVTRADREAEAYIAAALSGILSDAVVVGEEAAAGDPELLDAIHGEHPVWLVDPLDGTSNFIAGSRKFAVMVALLHEGVTTNAWIWRPIDAQAWVAERGSGTSVNGARMQVIERSRASGTLRGSVRTRFLDDEHRLFAEASGPGLGEILPGSGCAGVEYPELVSGLQDFVLFRRTLPWDHAPGALILQEAGGVARRWDGTDYAPGDGLEGLIASADLATWSIVEKTLLQPRHRRQMG